MTAEQGIVEAFFLPAASGVRFALFSHAHRTDPRGAFLYVHPFAEEMNKSRRMAALQARAFALAGFAVLQVDLHGCGDSSGDFGDARWDVWKSDVTLAADWLNGQVPGAIHLWGLRLGATLALECWQDQPDRYGSALIWQPVVDGESYLTQLLRLEVARAALSGGGQRITTQGLRARLADGHAVEVAGYALAPDLAAAVDAARLVHWRVRGGRVSWLDLRSTVSALPPASIQAPLDAWRSNGAAVTYHSVAAPAFWTSNQDIIEAPELIAATTAIYA